MALGGAEEGTQAAHSADRARTGPAGGCVVSVPGARAPRALAAVQVSRAAKPTATRAGSHEPSRDGV